MVKLEKLIKDEREGNKGRKEWHAMHAKRLLQPDPHKLFGEREIADALAMLYGAANTIDRLLDVIEDMRRDWLDEQEWKKSFDLYDRAQRDLNALYAAAHPEERDIAIHDAGKVARWAADLLKEKVTDGRRKHNE